MPEKKTLRRARKARREGKSPSVQAGEFVREEMHHVRSGKHGAKSREQVIAIGLAKARRAGVRLGPPKRRRSSQRRARLTEAVYAAKGIKRQVPAKPEAVEAPATE